MLFAGDLLFNGGTPFLLMGSVLGAIDVLEDVVRPLGARTIVPGHGPVVRARAHRRRARLPALRPRPRRAGPGRPGVAPLEPARETDLGAFAELDRPRSASSATCTAPTPSWRRSRPAAARSTSSARWRDMVAYNGGRPLTCLA